MSTLPERPPGTPGARAQVHDISFAGYDGERTSATRIPFVLAWWSLLRAFGRRRGWSAKFVPFSLLTLAFLPGVGVLTVRALVADQFEAGELPIDILPYAEYLGIIGALIVLWTALVTPEMVCPDIQHRVTTLYFATAVSPSRYVLGKWLASLTAMLGMTLLPVVVLWIGNILFAPSITHAIRTDIDQLPRIIAGGLLVAVFFSTLGLAIAALTGRRAYAIGALVGLVLGSGVLSGVLSVSGNDALSQAVNLVGVPILLSARLFEDNNIVLWANIASYVVIVAGAALILLNRFRSRG